MKIVKMLAPLLFVAAFWGCPQPQPLAVNPNIYNCLDFDDLSSGQTFVDNDVISGGGVTLVVSDDGWGNPRHARVDDRHYALGSGFDLNLNNISVDLQFDHAPELILFRFGDLGLGHTLTINGMTQTMNDLHPLDGQNIAGVDIAVQAENAGNNWYGIIGFATNPNQITVGSQELWIDYVCGVRSAEHVALLDIRRHAPGGSLPEFLIESLVQSLNAIDVATHKHSVGELNAGLLSGVDLLIFFPKRGKMTDAEKNVVRDFINAGGGVLILGDYVGPNTTTLDVYQDLFDIVDAVHEDNTLGNVNNPIVLSAPNFNTHPIIDNVTSFEQYAATTVSGPDYDVVVHTHNLNPANRPLIIAKEDGDGRVVVSGDASFVYDPSIANAENSQVFGQIVEWLLKQR
jgi:hypothetical protein